MTEHDLLMWLIPAMGALLSAIGIAVWQELRKITGSVMELNVKIAVVIERQNNHEVRIEKLEQT